jgi:3-dehydroquinate synthase
MKHLLSISIGGTVTDVELVSLKEAAELFSDHAGLAVFDKNTAHACGRPAGIGAASAGAGPVVLSPGEEHKNWRSVESILSAALDAGLARDSVVAGVGGGVVCDIAACAASLYMRGCRLILFPTSLLAMVDAAAGGKTGIDFGGYKNIVGTFYPAEKLYICIDYLNTLPERELRCGLAEVIKSAMLYDAALLDVLEVNREAVFALDTDIMLELVSRSLKVKTYFVESDFREGGIRAHLNLGHTFGHALESVSGFSRFSHGEAVAWGMLRALEAGIECGVTDPGYYVRIERILSSYGFPGKIDRSQLTAAGIYKAMSADKKKKAGVLRFVLQKDLCDTYLTELDKNLVIDVIERGFSSF